MALIRTLKDTPQNFTDSWVDYGDEIVTDGYKVIGLWLNIDINNTLDARFRALAKHTSGGDKHVFPIEIDTATVVNVEDEYCEFTTDEDAFRVVGITLDKIIPFIQIQIQAGTVGASAGQVLNSKYTLA